MFEKKKQIYQLVIFAVFLYNKIPEEQTTSLKNEFHSQKTGKAKYHLITPKKFITAARQSSTKQQNGNI